MVWVRFPEEVVGFYAHHYVHDEYGNNSALKHFFNGKSAQAQR
jgi:hypothetical protein